MRTFPFGSEAEAFLEKLQRRFDGARKTLVFSRTKKRDFAFREDTLNLRAKDWKVAAAPADLQDRRVEITGPAEPKMVINALNSGAKVFMADFEDSLSPSWSNIVEGQDTLSKAIRRTLEIPASEVGGKSYRLNKDLATLVVRPRGLHLTESNFLVDGEPMSASLFDFGVYFFRNAKELLARGSGPYFYLPKLEAYEEAVWWNDVFGFAQDELNIPRGTIRATVLVETLPAAFEMDEILYALREHAAGLNAGRWDYIFSLIKKRQDDPSAILPDRAQVKMSSSFMAAYCQLLVQTCHRRGAHAIGGMSAFIPNRREPEITERALEQVRADKKREAALGFDGTWVAHPDLVAVAQKEFDAVLKGSHQKDRIPRGEISASDLLETRIPGANITEAGVRNNINVALQYIERWLEGTGAVALHNLMEDAATAEISRGQLWQWRKHQAHVQGGIQVTDEWLNEAFEKECEGSHARQPLVHYLEARELLRDLIFSPEFAPFLTLKANVVLQQLHQQEN